MSLTATTIGGSLLSGGAAVAVAFGWTGVGAIVGGTMMIAGGMLMSAGVGGMIGSYLINRKAEKELRSRPQSERDVVQDKTYSRENTRSVSQNRQQEQVLNRQQDRVHSFSSIPQSDIGKEFEVRNVNAQYTTFAKPGVPKSREYSARNGTECEPGLKKGTRAKLIEMAGKLFFSSKKQEQKMDKAQTQEKSRGRR